MPSPASSGKTGRVSRVTRAHQEIDVARVECEGVARGPGPELVEQRQTRSSFSHPRKGKQVAALAASPDAPGNEPPADDTLDSEEAEELLSQAEDLLHEPLQGGQTKVARRQGEAVQNRLAAGHARDSAGAVSDGHQQIEEVPADTAADGTQAEPHIEEPESSLPAQAETAYGTGTQKDLEVNASCCKP